jgi:hypothetical protein
LRRLWRGTGGAGRGGGDAGGWLDGVACQGERGAEEE